MTEQEEFKSAAVTLRTALEHPSLYSTAELLERAEIFIRAGRKAMRKARTSA